MNAILHVRELSHMPVSENQQPLCHLLVYGVTGRLDASTVSILERALLRGFAAGNKTIVLDLAEVTYISSSGLRVLLTARREARERGGDIALCALSSNVKDVMDMVGFTVLFTIHDSVDTAISAIQSQRNQT